MGWIIFNSPETCFAGLKLLSAESSPLKELKPLQIDHYKKFIKVVPRIDKKRLEEHLKLSEELIKALDEEKGIKENKMLLAEHLKADQIKKLDLQIFYLRRVHFYCYFSAGEYQNERLLAVKCGGVFLREKVKEKLEDDKMPDWHSKVTSLVRMRISQGGLKTKQHQDGNPEEIIQNEVDLLIKRKLVEEEENAWPCFRCEKVNPELISASQRKNLY